MLEWCFSVQTRLMRLAASQVARDFGLASGLPRVFLSITKK